MPTKHPTWVERHGDGQINLCPPNANAFPSPKPPGRRRCLGTPSCGWTACQRNSVNKNGTAFIGTHFAHAKHYFLLMRMIKRACFTALNASANNAFKASNDPTIQGWHAGMQVINILDQLSTIFGQPSHAVLKTMTQCSAACTWPLLLLKSSYAKSKNVPRQPSLAATPTQSVSL
jgi:hypothetical protein